MTLPAPEGQSTNPGAPAPTPRSPPRRRSIIAAAVAVVVVVIVVLALFATGVLPGKGGGAGTGNSSATALAAANAYAKTVPGGPWNLSGMEGLDLTVAHTISLLLYGSSPSCVEVGTQNYTIPSNTGTYSNGDFTTWEFSYLNATGALNLAVTGGRVVAHLVEWPVSCAVRTYPVPGPLHVGNVTSTQAASAALADANVSSFVSAHPAADARAFQFRGYWDIDYTTCDYFYSPGAPAQGAEVDVGVNATTGQLNVNDTESLPSAVCALRFWSEQSIAPSDLFAVGHPIAGTCPTGSTFAANGCLAGDYTYRMTIVTSYVTIASVYLWVNTPTGPAYNLTGPGGFSVLTPQGAVAAQTAITSGQPMGMNRTFAVYGPGVLVGDLLPANDSIVLDMGTSNPAGLGLTFIVESGFFYPAASTPPVSLP